MKILYAMLFCFLVLIGSSLGGICDLPLEMGPCEALFRVYGFESGACRMFIYGGCRGNANNFLTKKECEEACPPTDICDLPLETGLCRAYFPSYGFKDGRCQRFIYGGCGGNANRFGTKEECENRCG